MKFKVGNIIQLFIWDDGTPTLYKILRCNHSRESYDLVNIRRAKSKPITDISENTLTKFQAGLAGKVVEVLFGDIDET